jgi:hypothetical protein
MKTAALALLWIAGCTKGEAEPKTTYFTTLEHFRAWQNETCGIPQARAYDIDLGVPRQWGGTERKVCAVEAIKASAALIVVRTEAPPGSDVCAITLGPTLARGPVDPTFAAVWSNDSEIVDELRRALATTSWQTESYQVDKTVRGLRVLVNQHLDAFGNDFFLSIDGCGRLPPRDKI